VKDIMTKLTQYQRSMPNRVIRRCQPTC